MKEKDRQRFVLQMFDPEVAELQERADSFLALSTRQRFALVAQEYLDLYQQEMQKDKDYEAAKKRKVSDELLIVMPRTDRRVAKSHLDGYTKALLPLQRDDHHRLELAQRMEIVKMQLRQAPADPNAKSYVLGKDERDKNWKPGAKA